jgi:hypothetical protein
MRFWRVSDGKVMNTWDVTPDSLLFTSGGESIWESEQRGTATLYRVSDGSELMRLNGDPKSGLSSLERLHVALTPDGKTLAGGTWYGDVWLWKLP